MVVVQFRRLEQWPQKPTVDRTNGTFRAAYPKTLELLECEIVDKLDGTDIVVQGFFSPREVRRDGWPASDARPMHPGIILSFRTKRLGEMVYTVDQYHSWRDNLRAIGLTLEALRAVRRYGTVDRDQQYRGFSTALTTTSVPEQNQAKVLAAATLLAAAGPDYVLATENDIIAHPELATTIYRAAVRRAHPDQGGTALQLQAVQMAIEVLRR